MNDGNPNPERSWGSPGPKLAVLFGLVIALAVVNVVLFQRVNGLKNEMSNMRGSLLTEISKLNEASSATTASSQQKIEQLREELDTARQQAATAVGQARNVALKHAEQLAKNLQYEQQQQQQQMQVELTEVKEATGLVNTRIADVSSDVGVVRTEVAATRSELEKTLSELRSVRGDLGVQSGLIATNSRELTALKGLGERNYFEFNLGKTRTPQRVGNVAVRLKKADAKRNRFTVEVLADDITTEKKDRTVNEPIQFYASGSRLPYELVVNEVKKNQIIGYLATPKVSVARY